jgi:hypothetical protein
MCSRKIDQKPLIKVLVATRPGGRLGFLAEDLLRFGSNRWQRCPYQLRLAWGVGADAVRVLLNVNLFPLSAGFQLATYFLSPKNQSRVPLQKPHRILGGKGGGGGGGDY